MILRSFPTLIIPWFYDVQRPLPTVVHHLTGHVPVDLLSNVKKLKQAESILLPQVYKFEGDRKAFWKIQLSQNDKLIYFSLNKMNSTTSGFFQSRQNSYMFQVHNLTIFLSNKPTKCVYLDYLCHSIFSNG